MKMIKKSIIFIILLAVFIIFITPIKSNANSSKNISNTKNFTEYTIKVSSVEDLIGYNPGSAGSEDTTIITNKLSPIVGTLIAIGVTVSVVALIIIGLKYMVGSVEEKAEYKKTMIPYLIGVFMVVGITVIIGVFSQIISDIFS